MSLCTPPAGVALPRCRTLALVATALLLSACASRGGGSAASPLAAVRAADAAALVRAMRARYDGKWLTTLVFVQNNTLYKSGGGEERTQWLEHMAAPGRLRIDYLPLAQRNGVLFADGRVHAFADGKQVQNQAGAHPLMVAGFDVYVVAPERTLRQLDSLGADLTAFREDTLEGRAVYVVGRDPGTATDTTRMMQLWVDRDSLLTRKLIERETRRRADGTARAIVTETRFNRYTDVGGYPVAAEMLFLRDGTLYFKEEYTAMRTNVTLPDGLFDPARWVEAQPALPDGSR